MHPLIKIIVFIIAGVFVVQASVNILLFMFSMLIGMSINESMRPGTAMWKSLWRLKWLWISLLIIYGWFTPGMSVWNINGVPAPSSEGLHLASARIAALMLLLWMAHLVWITTDKELFIGGIYQLLLPLQSLLGWAGFNREAVAVRLYLTFEQVDSLRVELERDESGERPDQKLISLCERIMTEAIPERRSLNMLVLSSPAPLQWFLPVLTGLILWYVER